MYRSIPTPTTSAFHIGPLTVHAYALCIIAGIVVAVWWGDRRYRAFGGESGVVADVAYFAVPFGIIGGRLYHLITSPDAYFGSQGRPLDAFKIWEGGLGIWGAIALGTLAAYWKFNKIRISRTDSEELAGTASFAVFADALAPGILIAQAIGRIGNWFNGELFGRPTTLPWGLRIPSDLRPQEFSEFTTFHPTFLYESLWCILVAILILRLERRFRAGQGFWFYVVAYSLGRLFIEMLRIDEAHTFIGMRINVFVSACVIVIAGFGFWRVTRVMPFDTRFHSGEKLDEE
jgi:prolipoprotein diacylglyceryl transferase